MQESKGASYAAAKAVVSGRFDRPEYAVKESEFKKATVELIVDYINALRKHSRAVELCVQEEQQRKKRLECELAAKYPDATRTQFDWQEAQFADLLARFGGAQALAQMTCERMMLAVRWHRWRRLAVARPALTSPKG